MKGKNGRGGNRAVDTGSWIEEFSAGYVGLFAPVPDYWQCAGPVAGCMSDTIILEHACELLNAGSGAAWTDRRSCAYVVTMVCCERKTMDGQCDHS